jgi:hypothetical protein
MIGSKEKEGKSAQRWAWMEVRDAVTLPWDRDEGQSEWRGRREGVREAK